jgi:hypothetical protein
MTLSQAQKMLVPTVRKRRDNLIKSLPKLWVLFKPGLLSISGLNAHVMIMVCKKKHLFR